MECSRSPLSISVYSLIYIYICIYLLFSCTHVSSAAYILIFTIRNCIYTIDGWGLTVKNMGMKWKCQAFFFSFSSSFLLHSFIVNLLSFCLMGNLSKLCLTVTHAFPNGATAIAASSSSYRNALCLLCIHASIVSTDWETLVRFNSNFIFCDVCPTHKYGSTHMRC